MLLYILIAASRPAMYGGGLLAVRVLYCCRRCRHCLAHHLRVWYSQTGRNGQESSGECSGGGKNTQMIHSHMAMSAEMQNGQVQGLRRCLQAAPTAGAPPRHY